ncbi:MAG TPA: GntR family transcriptional regulator, partial [Tepidisphaeraceae bacterium]
MSRSRSNRVSQVKEKLVARLGLGLFQGGDRFLSVRAITRQYDVSYQTADRLLRELTLEGRLRREHGSGTYVAGGTKLTKVQLVFNRRARRAGSFGSRLLSAIVLRLRQSGIPVVQTFVDQDQPARLSDDAYPILWEAAAAVDFLGQRGSTGMMVNGRPPPGLMALKIDSVA